MVLYNVQRALQDPFDEDGLDDIRVSKIQEQASHALSSNQHLTGGLCQLLANFDTAERVAEDIVNTGTHLNSA